MRTILAHARAITDLTELELTCCRLLRHTGKHRPCLVQGGTLGLKLSADDWAFQSNRY